MADSPVVIETNAKDVAYAMRLQSQQLAKAMRESGKEIEREILRDFRRTVSTWHHHPQFETINASGMIGVALLIGTNDKVYHWVDEGTAAHPIVAHTPAGLRFRTGFQPKTTPGVLASGPGQTAHGGWVRKMSVMHPGTRARHFSQLIWAKWQKQAVVIVERHVYRLFRKR